MTGGSFTSQVSRPQTSQDGAGRSLFFAHADPVREELNALGLPVRSKSSQGPNKDDAVALPLGNAKKKTRGAMTPSPG